MLSLMVSVDGTDRGGESRRQVPEGSGRVRNRTIEDDDGYADGARHGGTARPMPCRTAYYSNENDARSGAMRCGGDDGKRVGGGGTTGNGNRRRKPSER
jgi:hypothetical protein